MTTVQFAILCNMISQTRNFNIFSTSSVIRSRNSSPAYPPTDNQSSVMTGSSLHNIKYFSDIGTALSRSKCRRVSFSPCIWGPRFRIFTVQTRGPLGTKLSFCPDGPPRTAAGCRPPQAGRWLPASQLDSGNFKLLVEE